MGPGNPAPFVYRVYPFSRRALAPGNSSACPARLTLIRHQTESITRFAAIVWARMWIAAASGVYHDEQDVASAMASTTLSVGNANGLAVLIALTNHHTGGLEGDALRATVAEGTISEYRSCKARQPLMRDKASAHRTCANDRSRRFATAAIKTSGGDLRVSL